MNINKSNQDFSAVLTICDIIFCRHVLHKHILSMCQNLLLNAYNYLFFKKKASKITSTPKRDQTAEKSKLI